ncbi:hypothetical protein CP974_12140 [Streptomyces fradiae ATCC 10745 = DSM 40063]|nr:hypothetical protein CP974_12140 [Streptomyces fradiae ATCC 10745 = DSM 40063]
MRQPGRRVGPVRTARVRAAARRAPYGAGPARPGPRRPCACPVRRHRRRPRTAGAPPAWWPAGLPTVATAPAGRVG